MTTTKEELIGYIRNWVTTDNQLKNLRGEIKRLNAIKLIFAEFNISSIPMRIATAFLLVITL